MSRSLGATSLTILSPIRSVPPVISSSPAIIRRLVVLPQPDGPTRTMNSPSLISRLRSSTARTSPYFLVTCSNVTVALPTSSKPFDPARAHASGHRGGLERAPYAFRRVALIVHPVAALEPAIFELGSVEWLRFGPSADTTLGCSSSSRLLAEVVLGLTSTWSY